MKQFQIDSFLKYAAIPSQSAAGTNQLPSTPGQLDLAKVLAADLVALGAQKVVCNDNSVVTAFIPATKAGVSSIGFVAHLDTVNVGLSDVVKPQILKYEGQDLVLNQAENIVFKTAEHPEAAPYVGQEIIFSDGTSVLGADNKAAIATVMSMAKSVLENPVDHGDIHIAFVPDEEIGLCGAKALDMSVFCPDFAYTIDCCAQGEVVYETFNAGSGFIDIEGVTAHPMSAKGVLVNPILIAIDIANSFNRMETPENTDGTDGYIWVQGISGDQRSASLILNIRDHNKAKYEEKKALIQATVEQAIAAHPRAKITCRLEDVYANIADSIGEDRFPIDAIYQAMENLDITPNTIAMRGGTDGSALSKNGLLTPNYFTGALNFHSMYEFLPLPSFYKSFEMTMELIRIIAAK